MPVRINPWDQQPGESDLSYSRFLSYRNLGPDRTMLAAWRSVRSRAKHIPGHWAQESSTWDWSRRACSYDVWALKEQGRRTVRYFFKGIEEAMRASVEALKKKKPTTYAEAVDGLERLSKFLSPDVVRELFTEPLSLDGGNDPPRPGLEAVADAEPDATEAETEPAPTAEPESPRVDDKPG